jgi:crossover junction endodeoxyribonuclease RusA
VTSDNPNLKDWRLLVASAAQPAAAAHGLIAGVPVIVTLRFALPRPQSLTKRRERAHMTRPDLDKLVRACLDALTGVLFVDDGQVVALEASKRYAKDGEAPGVHVTLETPEPASLAPEPARVQHTPVTAREALPW